MNTVIVERHHASPLDPSSLRALEERVSERAAADAVRLRYAALARDGHRVASVYDARELEAVRRAYVEAGIAFDRMWRALILAGEGVSALGQRRERVFVQRTLPPKTTLDEYGALSAGAADCMLRHRARLLEAYLSIDGTCGLCHFEGIDAESVRLANVESQLPYDHAWTADFFDRL